jgi:hypothetical protein
VRSSSDARSGTYTAAGISGVRLPRGRISTTVSGARLPAVVHALIPPVILAFWALSIRHVDPRAMSDLGLISVMPATSIALLLALTVSFAFALGRNVRTPLVLSHVVVLIVMLYGVTAFVEAEPRFQPVWKHVGVIDYLERHGSVNPSIDAYFNWPGFFVLGGVITKVAGFSSPLAIAAWGPLAFNLLFLPPLVVIFRSMTTDPRLVWLSVWIFFSANWVGQDYISPQAVGFLIWLAIAAIVLRGSIQVPDGPGSALARGGLVLVVIVMFTAIVTGHQLTPWAVVLTLGGLALFTRLISRGLVWLLGIILLAWIAYMTTTYLAGNIGSLTAGLGALSSNVDQSVGNRVGGSPEHALIANTRIVMSLVIWCLALAGFLRRRQSWRTSTPLVIFALAPFVLPVLQPYGGEMLLRVFLFALPGVAFFVANLAFPSPSNGRRWSVTAGIAVAACLLLVAFQYTRYGNERLDYYTAGDLQTVHALYRLAPRGSVLFAGSYNLPWRYRDYADYDYRVISDLASWKRNPDATRAVLEQIRTTAGRRPAYVVITRSTRIASQLLDGTSAATLRQFVVRLSRAGGSVRQVWHGPDGQIFRVRGAAA